MNQVEKKIKVGVDLPSLKKSIEAAKDIMKGLEENGRPPKELTESFGTIAKILDRIESKTKDGIFRGSDAEYKSVINDLEKIGEKFSTIERLFGDFAKMDDDTLSRFLTKEDLQRYQKITKAVKKYGDALADISQAGKSQKLRDAQKLETAVQDKRTQAKEKLARRSQELEEARQSAGYKAVSDAREKVKTVKQSKSGLDSELKQARDTREQELRAQSKLKRELEPLQVAASDKKKDFEKAQHARESAEKKFEQEEAFYSTKTRQGQEKDKEQDYGAHSYSKAAQALEEARKREERAKKDYEAAKKASDDKQGAFETQTTKVEESIEAVKKAEGAIQNYNEVLSQTEQELEELEKNNKGSIDAYEAAEKASKSATAEVEKYDTACRDAAAKVKELSDNEADNILAEQKQAYAELVDSAKDLGINLSKLGIEEEYSEENAEKLKKALLDLNREKLEAIRIDKNNKKALDEFNKEQKENIKNTRAAAKEQAEYNEIVAKKEAFETRIKQFLGIAGAAQVLRAAARDAMATIKELDATMTEMAVVTDLSVGDYWDQLPEYSKRASELGVSVNSAYKAATLYYQQGLKTNEVNAISAETLKMAKIAGLDAADATDKMTAALRGFNMELNETSAQRVSDVYSELAAITAADTKEIANAMTKTASIASSAGMEFETTAAFLSQIIETTRESAETAGTAMKTVIARFQELKKSPDEIGEIDGEIVDANAIETALRSVGVSLRDANGQFRDLDDVFLELSSKWDTLDKNTQRYIATIAAGSRQQSRFIAMMSNYSRTQELVTAANNSAGASNKQFEKTMDSLEAKMEKLRNAWHEFTMGIMNSDLVKFGVDVLTKFLEVVNKATSGLNGLGGSITKILTILTVFKLGRTVFEKLKVPMFQFFADIVREAGITGERAGKAATEGLERSKQKKPGEKPGIKEQFNEILPEGYKRDKNGRLHDKEGKFVEDFSGIEGVARKGGPVTHALGWDKVLAEKDKKAIAQKTLDKLGPREGLEEKLAGAGQSLGLAKGRVTQAQGHLEKSTQKRDDIAGKLAGLASKGIGKETKEWQKVQKELDKANKKVEQHNANLQNQQNQVAEIEKEQGKLNEDLAAYDENAQIIEQSGPATWKAVGQAVQKTGAAITGVGIAASTLGGVFSALGMEEVGEAFSKAGNIITMVGGAVSALGTIVPAVTSILSTCGITLQASFWPILVIGLALVALVGTVALLVAQFEKLKAATPEGQLKAAEEATNLASEAADAAAESYDNLKTSLGELKTGYEVLDGLRRGTEEWQQAVNELNNQVLDLITTYPELASLMENKNGILTIDVDSKEVQQVLKQYKGKAAAAAGAKAFMQLDQSRAAQAERFSKLGANKLAGLAAGSYELMGWSTESMSKGIEIETAMLTDPSLKNFTNMFGARAQLGMQALPNLLRIYGGTAAGTLIPGIGNIGQMAYYGTEVMENSTEFASQQELHQGVSEIAKREASGEKLNVLERAQILQENGADLVESGLIATTLGRNKDALLEFAKTTEQVTVQQQAYYNSVAMQAQSMLDLAKYTEQEINQMNTVVASDLIDVYRKRIDERYADDDSEETEAALQEYMEGLENVGRVKKIKDNKIVYIDSEGKEQKVDKSIYLEQMKAAKATEEAANAMEAVPTAIQKASNSLGEYGDTFAKAFSASEGKALVASDLKLEVKDDKQLQEAFESMGAAGTDIWGDFATFKKDYQEVFSKANQAFEEAVETMNAIGFEGGASDLFGSMSAEAAQAWAKNLQSFAIQGGDVQSLQGELNTMLSGLSEEQVATVMGQINAIDTTDISAWEGLKKTFDELDIPIATAALQDFIDKGIEVSNAIEKINFDTFNKELHDTYELIQKIKSGGSTRSFDEDTYKQIIGNNVDLASQFRQIGDEFVYVGGSMDALVEALEENTIANIDEANRQLDTKIGFSKIAEGMELKDVGNMDEKLLRQYLSTVQQRSAEQGLDVADLGLKGFSNATDLNDVSITKDQLLEWAEAFAATGGQGTYYQQLKDKNMREADILGYTYNNTASENAAKASQSDKHAEALLIQAIQSGAVSEGVIEKYRSALDSGEINTPEFEKLAKSIADSTEKIIVSNENRDAMNDLVNRVTDALYDQGQKEIDKLSEIKDATDTANSNLINKIQEQIDDQRQARQNAETEKNIANMRSRAAYLGMSSGGNALALKELDKQIKDAEQDYQDTLVDQAIQDLQDANEKAAEQRERQIELAQKQLDSQKENGQLALQAASIVEEGLRQVQNGSTLNETTMYGLLFGAEAEGLSELEKEAWVSDLVNNSANAANYLTSKKKEEKQEKTEIQTSPVVEPIIFDVEGFDQSLKDLFGEDISLLAPVQNLYKLLTKDLPDWWNTFKEVAADPEQWSVSFESLGEIIGNIILEWNKLEGLPEKIGRFLAEKLVKLIKDLLDFLQPFFDLISNLKEAFTSFRENLMKEIQELIETTAAWFKGEASFGEVIEEFFDIGAVFEGVIESLRTIWKSIQAELVEGINSVIGTFNNLYNTTIGSLISGIHKVSPEILEDWPTTMDISLYELPAYKKGGIVNSTGPAWLDGTKSRPEYVLNAAQTERFFSLVDVLEGFDTDRASGGASGGDNHFEIEINVDKLENDYDVEQLADKIRRMLYDDASYRNVKAVGLMR